VQGAAARKTASGSRQNRALFDENTVKKKRKQPSHNGHSTPDPLGRTDVRNANVLASHAAAAAASPEQLTAPVSGLTLFAPHVETP
jgi:hypothetical protein